ncbi:DUF3243 domain-containing protein [Desulfotruncus alcoholivorax]|uniref:DUF3243 domain-containing protein n=1 Tax=Desulfotruncus alcoholivorax TaxID=265477 RepID=UPI000406675B|nr:DUF3243 domain-containing protein [Desulfotruncus alcoholivorax]
MEIETTWDKWKKTLSRAVEAAEFAGMSEKTIDEIAYRLGDFLANKIDPGNREQKLLNELWAEAGENEKRVLASLIVRMVVDKDN